jgi:hypothetical protein
MRPAFGLLVTWVVVLVTPESQAAVTCPARSTTAINCTSGSSITLPSGSPGLCTCSCGNSAGSAQTTDSSGNSLWFQSSNTGCTASTCASTFASACGTKSYKSGSWQDAVTYNSINGPTGPQGCTPTNGLCNMNNYSQPVGSICLSSTYVCNAAAIAANFYVCTTGTTGMQITSALAVQTASDCTNFFTMFSGSYVTNIACNTNSCNNLAALNAATVSSTTTNSTTTPSAQTVPATNNAMSAASRRSSVGAAVTALTATVAVFTFL